jgi:OOP family OmpA-OmpF porin
MSAPPAPAPPDPPPGKSAAPAPEVGIPAAAAPPEPFSLKDFTVYFTQNSTEIPLYANDVLSAAVVLLKSNPETRGRIEGHSDSIGDPSYNILVSENRAASVKNYLVRQGVEASRLTISGFGSGKPIEGNETPEGRSKNRRVVVRIVSGQSG